MSTFEIVISVVSILVAAGVGYPLFKLAKLKLGEEKIKVVFTVASEVVNALEEEIKGDKMGKARYEEAVTRIKDILETRFKINADNILIDTAIHAAVRIINIGRIDKDELDGMTVEEAVKN